MPGYFPKCANDLVGFLHTPLKQQGGMKSSNSISPAVILGQRTMQAVPWFPDRHLLIFREWHFLAASCISLTGNYPPSAGASPRIFVMYTGPRANLHPYLNCLPQPNILPYAHIVQRLPSHNHFGIAYSRQNLSTSKYCMELRCSYVKRMRHYQQYERT